MWNVLKDYYWQVNNNVDLGTNENLDEVISNDLEILANVLNINEIENFDFSETEHLNDQIIKIPKWEKVKENNFVYLFYLKFNIYNISLRYPGMI